MKTINKITKMIDGALMMRGELAKQLDDKIAYRQVKKEEELYEYNVFYAKKIATRILSLTDNDSYTLAEVNYLKKLGKQLSKKKYQVLQVENKVRLNKLKSEEYNGLSYLQVADKAGEIRAREYFNNLFKEVK